MSRIDETLRKIADGMRREGSGEASSPARSGYPGDPNCPICGGVGFIRQDLPVGHPDFGRLVMCTCLQRTAVQDERSRLQRFSNLEALKDKTFENFRLQGRMGLAEDQLNSLRSAYSTAQMFAQNLHGWLLLTGGYGSGKTHLAAAVANYAISMGVETLFLTVPDLLDWLRASYDSKESRFEQRFDEIRNVRLLVLDDLGTQNATPWAEEKLFQIINYRYTAHLPTVVTTNVDLEELDGRISSRLRDPDLVYKVVITAPDYRVPLDSMQPSSRTDLSLLSRYSLSNFSLREMEKLDREDLDSLSRAFRVAQEYAQNPRGWLVISGGYFCGKTHLAAAIGNYQKDKGSGVSFWVVSELLDHLRATFSPTSNVTYDHLFEEVKNAPLLILDDFGGHSSTAWAQEKLYQILSFRYNAELPTVITTLLKLDEIEPRLRSRMMDRQRCTFVYITVPEYIPGAKPEPRVRGRRSPR